MNPISMLLKRIHTRLTCDRYLEPLANHVNIDFDTSISERLTKANEVSVQVSDVLKQTKIQAVELMESLVKQSENERRKLEIVFNGLDEPLLICDSVGLITSINGAARQLLKFPSDEIIGKNLVNILNGLPASIKLDEETKKYKEFVASKKSYSEYLALSSVLNQPHLFNQIRSDGAQLELQVTINLLNSSDVEVYSYLVAIKDVTEKSINANRISNLQAFSSSLLSVSQTPIFYKDLNFKFLTFNKRFAQLLGLSDMDIVGKSVQELFDEESAERLTQLDHAALSSDEEKHETIELKTLNGLIRNVKVSTKAVRISTLPNGIAGSITVSPIHDPDARRQIFSLAARCIVFLDSDMRIVGCNNEFLRMIGGEKDSIVGLSSSEPGLADFLHDKITTHSSDDIIVNDRKIHRLCSPINGPDGIVDGMVYVFFQT
jgi:PAS domain S-box-containing protein